jgi:hypothetical protein
MAASRSAYRPRSGASAAKENVHRFRKRRWINMSTTMVPALDMNKLNAFIGEFVTDLGAAVLTGMVVMERSWDSTKPSSARH